MPWRRKPRVPKGLQPWPVDAVDISTEKVIELYGAGFQGTLYQPEEREKLFNSVQWPNGEDAATTFGLADTGKGKSSLPFVPSYRHWPKCWPCPGQKTGDCVGHGGKNIGLVLIGVEAELGVPDPLTGIIEGFPEVSEEAESQGVVACENIYGDRGHSGEGASCDRLIQHVIGDGGIMLRKKYDEINLDLTKYDVNIEIKWGRNGTPAEVKKVANQHKVRTATNGNNHEVCRDFINNGYPIWSCSGLGWSSERDENGYSKRSGSWSHSWIIMGYDDREETVKRYGFPLALYNHDWGKWNTGGRKILGTDILIPDGSMWIDARLLDDCDCTAMSSINGWPRRQLPDYSLPVG